MQHTGACANAAFLTNLLTYLHTIVLQLYVTAEWIVLDCMFLNISVMNSPDATSHYEETQLLSNR